MAYLIDLAAQLNADADASDDPAEATIYRLRARQAEELARYDTIKNDEQKMDLVKDFSLLPNFWQTPRETADAHHVVRFHWDEGGLVAVEIARTDGDRLRLSDLRDSSVFPFRELIRLDREDTAEQNRLLSFVAEFFDDDAYTAHLEKLRKRVEGSRSPYSPEHWEKVARIYSEAVANHDPAPVRRVAKEFTVARSTARNWVAKCRKLEYLPPTEERKAKGNL